MDVAKKLPKRRWHLAQFKPSCAMIARRNLVRQGFEVFLPLEAQTRVHRGNFIHETRPFFPGYLFVCVNHASSPVQSIRSTYGISQLVRIGTKPAVVPDGLVEELRARCDPNDVVERSEILEKGDKVRLTAGPFANLIGEVEQIAPDQRVWLLLDIMGQKTKVSVAQSTLQATA